MFVWSCAVETPQQSCDDPAGIPVSLHPGPGYIANLVTEATGCGGVRSPWRIDADPGQTISRFHVVVVVVVISICLEINATTNK